ncbi:hypothetical protein F511_35004, partial [Dorcoceras hygrometricum]
AKDILYKTLDKNMFRKIKTCANAKEIWEKLTLICEGNDETKENKLTVSQQKYESIKMREGETITEFDERFSSVVIDLTSLRKEYNNRELALKVMRALPREWDVKTMAMQESKDLNKMELHDLFTNLKAYEFKKPRRLLLLQFQNRFHQAIQQSKSAKTYVPLRKEVWEIYEKISKPFF